MRASEAANLLVEHYAEGATQHRTFKTLCVAALDLWLGQAHAIAGDINGASAHFSAMRSQRVAVTSRTLGKLIRCAAEARRPEQAVQFLEQGSGQGVCESLIAYTSVVDAFAKAGQPVEAEAWLRQMKSKG
ncbi:unnamed protein product, partial [Effrenium voratum]